MTSWIEGFAEANPWPAALAAVVVALVGLGLLARGGRAGARAFRARRYSQGRLTVAQMVSVVGALGATGVGANTAWRFAGEHLHITNVVERAALFLVGEVMLFGLALMARQNLHNPSMRRTGLPGTLVWVLSGFLAVPAISESDSFAGAAWRIVLGPLGAALLWHLAMGIELRQSGEEDAENNGVGAKILRRVQQQILSWLGIADHDVTAEDIYRERARSKAADLVDRLRNLDEKKSRGRKGRKLRAQLRTTLRKAGVAGSQERKQLLLEDLAVSAHAPALVDLEHASPWEEVLELATVPAVPALEAGHPLPASKTDADEEEWKQLLEAAAATNGQGEDGPDDDHDGPKGPGGAPLPEQKGDDSEAVLNATVWAPEAAPESEPEPVLTEAEIARARHIEALKGEDLKTNADAIRYAIQETGTTVAGQLVRWLAEHGREGVNEGQAYRVAKKQEEEQRRSNVRPLRPTTGA
ncbi:hypothetical protein ABZ135_32740 [Streptomyces sp. NPDC006339]|uniref:hypothetical protein n=1 Tax=Streptomyces sp. NPDC006339 TaxID=3156755 RepID=UPI0033A21853